VAVVLLVFIALISVVILILVLVRSPGPDPGKPAGAPEDAFSETKGPDSSEARVVAPAGTNIFDSPKAECAKAAGALCRRLPEGCRQIRAELQLFDEERCAVVMRSIDWPVAESRKKRKRLTRQARLERAELVEAIETHVAAFRAGTLPPRPRNCRPPKGLLAIIRGPSDGPGALDTLRGTARVSRCAYASGDPDCGYIRFESCSDPEGTFFCDTVPGVCTRTKEWRRAAVK
jgi:hypothetical protein